MTSDGPGSRRRAVHLDGDHAGHVIGIVVADYRNADARAAWMMPTETIRGYLPGQFGPYVAGQPADRLGAAAVGLPELGPGDTLRVALTRGQTGELFLPPARDRRRPGSRGRTSSSPAS